MGRGSVDASHFSSGAVLVSTWPGTTGPGGQLCSALNLPTFFDLLSPRDSVRKLRSFLKRIFKHQDLIAG